MNRVRKMNIPMTKEQAAQILDQAISQMKLSRQDHAVLQQALEVLKKAPLQEVK